MVKLIEATREVYVETLNMDTARPLQNTCWQMLVLRDGFINFNV